MSNIAIYRQMRISDIKRTSQYRTIPRGTLFDGIPKSRLPKSALCTILGAIPSAPPTSIVYLRLHPDADATGALHTQSDLLGELLSVCTGYRVVSHVFRSFYDILTSLLAITDQSVAHVVILSHGTKTSIQVGVDAELSVHTTQFELIVDQLRRIMLPRASICLTACNVGSFNGADLYSNPSHLIELANYPAQNFGNVLAQSIGTDHAVYCTSGTQTAGELGLIALNPSSESVCASTNSNPFYFGYISATQTMFRFIHTDTKILTTISVI